MLAIVIFEADRSTKLEDADFVDQASSVDCRFDYALDGLGIPAENDTFSREPFNALFYNDYWLEHQFESLEMVLAALEELRDSIAERSNNAEALRAGFHVIDSDGCQTAR